MTGLADLSRYPSDGVQFIAQAYKLAFTGLGATRHKEGTFGYEAQQKKLRLCVARAAFQVIEYKMDWRVDDLAWLRQEIGDAAYGIGEDHYSLAAGVKSNFGYSVFCTSYERWKRRRPLYMGKRRLCKGFDFLYAEDPLWWGRNKDAQLDVLMRVWVTSIHSGHSTGSIRTCFYDNPQNEYKPTSRPFRVFQLSETERAKATTEGRLFPNRHEACLWQRSKEVATAQGKTKDVAAPTFQGVPQEVTYALF